MMAGRLGENARPVNDPAALGILGAKAQRRDAGDGNCRRAHRTWLQRHPQSAIVEAGGSKLFGRAADGDHFGMSGRVRGSAHGVARFGDD